MCIEHMAKITANESHRHDDIADTLSDAIRIALIENQFNSHISQHNNTAATIMQNQKKISSMRRSLYGGQQNGSF